MTWHEDRTILNQLSLTPLAGFTAWSSPALVRTALRADLATVPSQRTYRLNACNGVEVSTVARASQVTTVKAQRITGYATKIGAIANFTCFNNIVATDRSRAAVEFTACAVFSTLT